jgi:hypothetical protein
VVAAYLPPNRESSYHAVFNRTKITHTSAVVGCWRCSNGVAGNRRRSAGSVRNSEVVSALSRRCGRSRRQGEINQASISVDRGSASTRSGRTHSPEGDRVAGGRIRGQVREFSRIDGANGGDCGRLVGCNSRSQQVRIFEC